mmetsp:Transcript_7332/g.23125  ORF Transcript_7332/g.23125 Transcript_7332/m.23125 type:complete len:426 (+) Transcript_7332:1292-2569(+)
MGEGEEGGAGQGGGTDAPLHPPARNAAAADGVPERVRWRSGRSGRCSRGLLGRDARVGALAGGRRRLGRRRLVRGDLLVDLGAEQRGAHDDAHDEEVPHGRPTARVLQRADGHETKRGGDGARTVDNARHRAKHARVAADRRVVGEVGGDGAGDNVVRPADEDAHHSEQDEEGGGRHRVGEHGEDPQERREQAHEGGDHTRAPAIVEVRDETDDHAAGHHAHGVERRDDVGRLRVKVLAEEEGEPEEARVVDELEEAKGDRVPEHVGDHQRLHEANRLLLAARDAAGRDELRVRLLVLLRLDPNVGGAVGQEEEVDQTPQAVGDARHKQRPLPRPAVRDDERGGEGGDDVADVLVAGPQAEDEAAPLLGPPCAHHGRVDRAARRLEEAVHELRHHKEEEAKAVVVVHDARGLEDLDHAEAERRAD